MKISKKTKIVLVFLMIFLSIFVFWVIYENKNIQVNELTVKSEKLPEAFSGYKIAHISDLHNTEFDNNNNRLLTLIKYSCPDIIVITGDIVDSRKTNVQIARDFINNAAKIAPVYYVTGNHEARVNEKNRIDSVPLDENITILHNKDVLIQKGKSEMQIIGVNDPDYASVTHGEDYMNYELEKYSNDKHFKILLSHRPELFDAYVSNNIDIIFSGHAHGGQFRLPFVGGIIAPHQGLFPEYDSGLYTKNSTNLIVSRGLGNSIFPFRINNPPEIIVVTLEK